MGIYIFRDKKGYNFAFNLAGNRILNDFIRFKKVERDFLPFYIIKNKDGSFIYVYITDVITAARDYIIEDIKNIIKNKLLSYELITYDLVPTIISSLKSIGKIGKNKDGDSWLCKGDCTITIFNKNYCYYINSYLGVIDISSRLFTDDCVRSECICDYFDDVKDSRSFIKHMIEYSKKTCCFFPTPIFFGSTYEENIIAMSDKDEILKMNIKEFICR